MQIQTALQKNRIAGIKNILDSNTDALTQRIKLQARMKVFVATAVALISLSLAWTTLAAPIEWATSEFKNQLLKSIISEALIQQEDAPSAEDKEMAAKFCKIMVQILKFFHLSDEDFGPGEGSLDDYCEDFELPPEPRPEDKTSTLAKAYEVLLNKLKNSGIEDAFEELFKYVNSILDLY